MLNNLRVGIDIGGTKLLMIAGTERLYLPTGSAISSEQLEEHIRYFLCHLKGACSGIGIAVPGLVDAAGCVAACDVLPKLVGWNPIEAFADLNCPINVINDVNAALIEAFPDPEPNLTAGVIMVGTGVGAAFLCGGVPLVGANGWAGELGYLPTLVNGEVKRLDELAGGAFIAKRLSTDARNLALRAQLGDSEALEVIREGGHVFGIALAAVINLLNPAKLVLGGGTFNLPGYKAAAYGAAECFSLPELWKSCSLEDVKAGDAVVALGAARAVVLHHPTHASEKK